MIPAEFKAEDAIQVLGDFATAIETLDLSEAFEAASEAARAGFKKNFDQTQGPGYKWAPHSPYTIQKYGPHPLLILSGAMLQATTESGAAGSVHDVQPREAVIGTDIFYAAFQQFGTLRIPARRFVWLDAESVAEVEEEFEKRAFTLLVGVNVQ